MPAQPLNTADLPLVSVIIPAYKDAVPLRRALTRLRQLRQAEYPNLELIAAVRPAPGDATLEIANNLADRVVPGGRASEGRNNAIGAARGAYILFQDADHLLQPGALTRLVRAASKEPIIATTSETPLQNNWRAHIANVGRNIIRGLGIVKGFSGFIFIDTDAVKTHQLHFDPDAEPGDIYLYYREALRAGARYTYVRVPGGGYSIDHRRYLRDGYLRTIWFWIRFGLVVRLGGKDPNEFAKQYWVA